jgi:hypothetical protein
MWPKRKQKTDWMGHYNTLLEQRGESSKMGCLIEHMITKERKQVFYDHTRYDGLGSLVVGMRQHGFDVPEFPRLKLKRTPNFFQMLYLVLRFIYHELKPVKPIKWKYQNPNPPYKTLAPFPHYFDEEKTKKLITKAESERLKLPTLVLYALNRAVNEHLIEDANISRWHIPVNMRGVYEGPTEDSNHISNFIVTLKAQDTPKNVFDKSSKELKSGSFLAAFFMLNLGDYLGFGGLLKNKVQQDYQKPKVSARITGTFSTLGVWPPQSEITKSTDLVIFPHSNVSLKNPICSVDVVWHKKLCFALAFHSSIVKDEEQCRRVLQSMVRILEEYIQK